MPSRPTPAKKPARPSARGARPGTTDGVDPAAKPLPKAEQVYREIREQILTGALEPGASIDKLTLCQKLGVSRFPVSAAIHRLAFEKLVTIEPQHGSFVSRMSPHAIREYMMIRRALESEIASIAAPWFEGEVLADLRRNLDQQVAAAAIRDVPAFYALDVSFHQIVARPLQLTHAGEALEAARMQLERMRRLILSPAGRLDEIILEHRAVVDALAAGDAAAAAAAMRRHLEEAGDRFEIIIRERPELFCA